MSSTRLPLRDNLFKEIYRIEDEVPNFKSYVAGEWIEFPSKITVKSPIDGSIIARVSIPDWEAIDRTLDLVYVKGRWSIRNTPGEKRLKIIDKIADLMEEHKDEFIETLIVDAGKPVRHARGEVEASIDRLRKAPLDLRKLEGDYVPGDWSIHTLESEGIVRREPYGVVLAIIPFNYPLFDTVNKFVYSVIPGNAFIIKPPSSDPISTLMFVRVVLATGFPADSIAIIPLPGKEASKLVADRRIHVISLTGSTKTGLEVIRNAGIKQFILELGGGDPAIVLADADLATAAQKIAIGVTSYSGQRCDAIKIILVEEPIYEEFKKLLVEELSKIRVGDPRDPSTDMGPLIEPQSVDEMIDAVEEAKSYGCKILYGGKRLGGNYVEPTLIEVTERHTLKLLKLYRDEVFAPVAIITKFRDLDEAIELANNRRYGLDAAIFGENIDKIRKLVRFLEVGAIYVNEYPRHGIGYYPFGGRKDSGIGREGIGYSIEHVTATKTIIYNYRGKGIWEYL
ncbi:MAG: NADP-dependent glyceraldehyde-3-phosphate dehydrogenase [Acidilobaceae archaeon]